MDHAGGSVCAALRVVRVPVARVPLPGQGADVDRSRQEKNDSQNGSEIEHSVQNT